MDGVGQEESEPSALSSGEGPHFSLSAQPQGYQPLRWACPGPHQTAFFLLVLIPSPKDHHFSTQPPKFKTKSVNSLLPLPSCPFSRPHHLYWASAQDCTREGGGCHSQQGPWAGGMADDAN